MQDSTINCLRRNFLISLVTCLRFFGLVLVLHSLQRNSFGPQPGIAILSGKKVFNMIYGLMHNLKKKKKPPPGIEPGSPDWKASNITNTLSPHGITVY